MGGGVGGVPLREGDADLVAERGVELLELLGDEGQPRVQPRVHRDGVRARVPRGDRVAQLGHDRRGEQHLALPMREHIFPRLHQRHHTPRSAFRLPRRPGGRQDLGQHHLVQQLEESGRVRGRDRVVPGRAQQPAPRAHRGRRPARVSERVPPREEAAHRRDDERAREGCEVVEAVPAKDAACPISTG